MFSALLAVSENVKTFSTFCVLITKRLRWHFSQVRTRKLLPASAGLKDFCFDCQIASHPSLKQKRSTQTLKLSIIPNVASIIRSDGVYPRSSVIGVVFARSLALSSEAFSLPSYQNEIVYNQHTPWRMKNKKEIYERKLFLLRVT